MSKLYLMKWYCMNKSGDGARYIRTRLQTRLALFIMNDVIVICLVWFLDQLTTAYFLIFYYYLRYN